jgi:hypothetical protein
MWLADDHRKVTVWDLGKYYQGPFVGALQDWKIRPDVQAQIAAMKKRRANFKWSEIDRIRQYCLHECEALADFATELEKAHDRADLKPRGWYGPGSTASVALKRHDIHELRGITPPPMLDPVARAFFGGRAEISRNGAVEGPIYGLDISSAYPAQAAKLPCLEHGRWVRVTRERDITGRTVAHALVHGHIRGATGAWAPLPVRIDRGHIVFPRSGASGWWWRDEWLAARKGWKGLEFDHAFVLRRECDCKPFDFVPALFHHRLAVGKETGEGKVIKLALNSLYGKLAQRIGSAQFASQVWAGMITSGTRAQVLDMMQRHKRLDSVLMIATDGLFTTESIEVEQEIVLGGWERKVYDRITLVRPGIYWLGEDKLRARGLGRDSLGEAKVHLAAALVDGTKRVTLSPRVSFGGAKLNVRAHNGTGKLSRSPVYGQWHTIPTHVSLKPDPKRAQNWSPPALDGVESLPFGTAATRKEGEFYDLLELFRDYLE